MCTNFRRWYDFRYMYVGKLMLQVISAPDGWDFSPSEVVVDVDGESESLRSDLILFTTLHKRNNNSATIMICRSIPTFLVLVYLTIILGKSSKKKLGKSGQADRLG